MVCGEGGIIGCGYYDCRVDANRHLATAVVEQPTRESSLARAVIPAQRVICDALPQPQASPRLEFGVRAALGKTGDRVAKGRALILGP